MKNIFLVILFISVFAWTSTAQNKKSAQNKCNEFFKPDNQSDTKAIETNKGVSKSATEGVKRLMRSVPLEMLASKSVIEAVEALAAEEKFEDVKETTEPAINENRDLTHHEWNNDFLSRHGTYLNAWKRPPLKP